MTRLPAFVLFALLVLPSMASAQSDDDQSTALRNALRGLLNELQPALDQAFELLQEFQGIDDPRHYKLPEVLPNGDIIIRRRQDAPPLPRPPDTSPSEDDGSIDL